MAFVIPFLVSGPDYAFYQQKQRWRRGVFDGQEAPWVTPLEFMRGFARRIESQTQRDWSALPIIRSIAFKYNVETDASSCIAPFTSKRSEATEMSEQREKTPSIDFVGVQAEDDSLYKLRREVDCAGLTLCEIGVLLRLYLESSKIKNSRIPEYFGGTH